VPRPHLRVAVRSWHLLGRVGLHRSPLGPSHQPPPPRHRLAAVEPPPHAASLPRFELGLGTLPCRCSLSLGRLQWTRARRPENRRLPVTTPRHVLCMLSPCLGEPSRCSGREWALHTMGWPRHSWAERAAPRGRNWPGRHAAPAM
jgi:hypothetical protein